MHTDTLTIRTATPHDAYRLAWFGATTFMAAYAGLVPDDALFDYVAGDFSTNSVSSVIADPGTTIYIAETQDDLAGYALVRSSRPPAFVPGSNPLELGRLYVDANRKRQGIGSRLVAAASDDATQAGFDALWLTVWERNPTAIAAYCRWGFKEYGSRRFEFSGQVHRDLVMAKVLS
jgi:ribosomal protein S18 acetylase RimI-like enzyme